MQFNEPNKKYTNPFIKYCGFVIEKSDSEKYPDLVKLVKTPKSAVGMGGKQYLNETFAVKAIDVFIAEDTINRGNSIAKKEVVEIGLDPEESDSDESDDYQ
jgi:hypothetical protein